MVIHYPAFSSRFVSLETSALDHYVNIPLATSKGDFKHATAVLFYSARTARYSGESIAGVDKIMEMSGDFATAALRVMPEAAEPKKLKENMASIAKVKLQTLSEFEGRASERVAKIPFPPYSDTLSSFSNDYLQVMQFVFNHTTFDPDDEMDQAALAALAQVGVDARKEYDADQIPEIDGKQLGNTAKEITKKQLVIWNDPKRAAPFLTKLFQPKGHTDIDSMVLQSAVGPLGQPADQAMYPGIATGDGKPMNAQRDYVIRMTKEEMPPYKAFWSATLYDSEHGFFIPNKQKKYSVGQNAGMQLNASGGIEIHIAAEQPHGVPAENWLPISRKDQGLDVIMRDYVPDLEKMKTWKAPVAETVN
jgi:hypothetical protein